MKLTFWGVRGSLPTPGDSTFRYGGNTPSLELRLDGGELVIFDAGSGIRNLGDHLARKGEKVKAFLMITHPHWDHIQGFPFFKPAFIPGNELTIIGTDRTEKPLSEILSDQMNRIYFPVQLNDLKAKINFLPIREEGMFDVFDATVRVQYVNHPGFTVGYRIEHKGKTLVYISDNEPFDPAVSPGFTNFERTVIDKYLADGKKPNKRLYEFCKNADVLIHDSTYSPEELAERRGWGHSDYLFALTVAREAGVKRLWLFHHDHTHSDEVIDAILAKTREEARAQNLTLTVDAAREGAVIEI